MTTAPLVTPARPSAPSASAPPPEFQRDSRSGTQPAKPWALKPRLGTGVFIVSQAETLLARIDQASGTLYLFDKRTRSEVAVNIRDLLPAPMGV